MGFQVNELSGMDYMRERIQESRQKETISYLMFIAGAVFFIGGLIETVTSPGTANWFLFIPYKIGLQTNNFLSLFLVINGFMLLVFGLCAGIYYNFDRSSYLSLVTEVKNRQKIYFAERGVRAFSKELRYAQSELGECKLYLMNNIGLDERDSIYYCKLLGKHWHELVEEEKLLQL